jgi:ABC-type transport system involved in Fe-S cluster assembly fused permease/ATPase subunit
LCLSLFSQKATDALLNFETVKYFNAEQHEELRYDAALQRYSHANIRTQQTLAVLNAGQQVTQCRHEMNLLVECAFLSPSLV